MYLRRAACDGQSTVRGIFFEIFRFLSFIKAEARCAGYITRDDRSAPVLGADPQRQKRAHAQRPASRADRRLDPRVWLHQPGADRRRGRHYRRRRPGARRAFARPRRGAVHRPGAPHADAAPRLCARRQQAGAQRQLGSRDEPAAIAGAQRVVLATDAGEELPDAHCLQNRGTADALVLEIGSRIPGEYATYSDIDMKTEPGVGYVQKDGKPYPKTTRRGPG